MISKKIQIEIWTDIVCPFCLVGKKNLEKAIKELNIESKTEIIINSFQLEPSFPENISKPSLQHLCENKGYPIEHVKAMCDQLTLQGHSLGINFNFDDAKIFNTFDAHRLVQWARLFKLDVALNDALMVAYTSEGVDLSKVNNLMKIIKKVGLDTNKATEILNSEVYASNISEQRNMGLGLGLRGVPFYRINNKNILSGVQSPEVIKSSLKNASQDLGISTTTEKTSSCSIDGVCE